MGDFEDEYTSADASFEKAVAAFVDFLEAIRHGDEQQMQEWQVLRDALPLKELRQELDALQKRKQQQNAA